MATHSGTSAPPVPPVTPDQPPGGWPQWLREIAQSINQMSAWSRAPVLTPFTYDTLPRDLPGRLAYVTDANTAAAGVIISAGGGANRVLAWFDGANWKVVIG